MLDVFYSRYILQTAFYTLIVCYFALVYVFISKLLVLSPAVVLHVLWCQILQHAILVVREFLGGNHDVKGSQPLEVDLRQSLDADSHLTAMNGVIMHSKYVVDGLGDATLQRHLDHICIHQNAETKPVIGLNANRVAL